MQETVKVLFASATEDLVPSAIQHAREIFPELPLIVVSEFRPATDRWIPFHPSRTFGENLALCRWHFKDKKIRLCAVVLQPHKPYWRMRWIAFLLAPAHFLVFNEYFGHFMLRPQSLPAILRHFAWRLKNFVRSQLSAAGATYTFVWRLGHPHAFRRPIHAWLARAAGWISWLRLSSGPPAATTLSEPRPAGISVVIPSRNGKDLLAEMLPEVTRQNPGEIIVVDNGSDDGTAEFLRQNYPAVVVKQHPEALSFARAVNAGIRAARYSHVCLLNNDMVIREGFFTTLREAFDKVPDLFCATAQIFFPEGVRREETGKAVMPFPSERKPADFPLYCELPLPGEDLSYVLYGSGGCSLFAADKLMSLGGLNEIYDPAYVEDLDLGFRGWRQGWPSVFVAAAQVVHRHRSTTSRYFSPEYLGCVLEVNYLRFLAATIADKNVFRRLWQEAIRRLNVLAAQQEPDPVATAALAKAWPVALKPRRITEPVLSDSHILAIGSGAVIVTPGRPPRQKPVVLVASSHVPFPLSHGGVVRMFNLMRGAARDFDQVLVAFTDQPGEVPAELRNICCEVVQVKRPGTHRLPSTARPDMVEEFDSPAFHAALRQTVRKWKPAIAQMEFTQMAPYASDCAPAKTILVEHDVTFDLNQQLLAQADDWETRRQFARWIPFETAAWSQVDRVVTMSEKDRALVVQYVQEPDKVKCIANGVDLNRFQPSAIPPDPARLLFIGSFAHLPNILALDFFLREVWPQLQKLNPVLHIIAGSRPEYFLDRYQDRVRLDLTQPGLEVEAFVADVRPAYQRAAIVVAPLIASAGTNIKIMEAMAMGKAIVSTPAGINGLDLEAGSDVIVTLTGGEMTAAIARLIEYPEQRESIERRARSTVERKYDWDAIAREQKQMYDELLALGKDVLGTCPK